jgi:hypothetical protein
MDDHDLLVQLCSDVRDIKKAVEGNGQPGLVTRMGIIEGRLAERDRTAMKAGGGAAATAVLLGYLWEWVKGQFSA